MPRQETYSGCTDCCGGGVANDCCDGIAQTLSVTLNGSGDCDPCGDDTFEIFWNGAEWEGDIDLSCGWNFALGLRCHDSGGGIFVWQVRIEVTGGDCDGTVDGWRDADSSSCGPFQVNVVPLLVGCCGGVSDDFTMVITE